MGCEKVHAGCDHCYAEVRAHRFGDDIWGGDKPRKIVKKSWGEFLTWQAEAAEAGEVHRVFINSLSDLFEKSRPLIDTKGQPMEGDTGQLRDKFFNEVVPACPNLLFLLLTKRPSNINKMTPERWKTNPPSNVMFGTSPVDQKTFDTLVPQLQKVKGRKFLSIEPQLDFIGWFVPEVAANRLHGIDWVIQGGESGPNRRPFDLSWAYRMKQICSALAVPYFFKQIDKVKEIPADLQVRQFPGHYQNQ